jgi:hypothetical protein
VAAALASVRPVDLQLYFRVLWRFKFLVALGVLLAIGLAVLSFAAPNFSGKGPMLQPRQGEQWVSYSETFVTQEGFLWGQTKTTDPTKRGATGGETQTNPQWFAELAVLYARLATSDPVRAILLKGGPMHGEIDAAPVLASDNNTAAALPLVRIAAIADTEQHAFDLVVRTTQAFRTFIAQLQEANKIPEGGRVRLTVIKRADKPQLLSGRSMTLPMVVFIAVMILVSGLCFILENMRPRKRPHAVAAAEEALVGDARLSA